MSVQAPEMTMSEESSPSRSNSEPMTPQSSEISSLDDSKKLQRLKFLVEKSKIYASILTERLENKGEKKGAESDSNTEKNPREIPQAQDADSTRSSTLRRSSRRKDQQAETPQENKTAKSRKGTKNGPANNKKKVQKSILDFGQKEREEVKQAIETPDTKSTKEVLKEEAKVDGNDKLDNNTTPSVGQPSLVTGGSMHSYQVAGMEWLVSLYENGLNGILADEMGLGKTLQTISFLAHLIEHGVDGPFLIVAPLSTVENWVNEVKRFTPSVNAIKYHGNQEERTDIRRKYFNSRKYPIIVTSYEIIVRDAKFLRKYDWKYVIVDEGHRIKNMNCRLIMELKSLNTANRLLLTGTPLQNKLAELWSLLNFLLPDVFTDLNLFQEWFEEIGENDPFQNNNEHSEQGNGKASSSSDLVTSLHSILRPFLLRRLKTDVEHSLPPKREYIIYGDLSQEQVELYQSFLNRQPKAYIINKILESRGANTTIHELKSSSAPALKRRKTSNLTYTEASDDEDDYDDQEFLQRLENENLTKEPETLQKLSQDETTQSMIKSAQQELKGKGWQNMIVQLRQACNSPYLFYYPWTTNDTIDERIVSSSGKMSILDKLSQELIENGHKILIFSQFTKMLDILEDWAGELRGWKYRRIDGSTDQVDRQASIDDFNTNSDTKIFLLSTRAGGLGINLSAADTVIIFDSDWNPQQDLQAIDRAHRIGQTRPVMIYRLATRDTVEQRLLERADAKRNLEKMVIEKGKFKGLLGLDSNASTEEEVLTEISNELQRGWERKMNDNKHKKQSEHIITDNDLKIILDRAPEAYENSIKLASQLSDNIKLV